MWKAVSEFSEKRVTNS